MRELVLHFRVFDQANKLLSTFREKYYRNTFKFKTSIYYSKTVGIT